MKKSLYVLLMMSLISSATAQTLSAPPSGDNQKSIVKQYIGSMVHVAVTYNSPDVTAPNGDNRTGKIWGELVPYGMTDLGFGLRTPAPWRAGANENTVIYFSHDVMVEGEPIAAGKYGLHLIVQEEGDWTWIFSRSTEAWGSYYYEEKDDALRVNVTPQDANYHEWLTYEFTDRQADQATLALFWENKMVPMTISVPDMDQLYVDAMREELKGSAGFNYQNLQQAANFCAQRKMNLDEALVWADNAIGAPFVGQENFGTLQTKAQVLMAKEDMVAAQEVMDKAIHHATATPFQIHAFGRQLIGMGEKEKAMEVFQIQS